MNDQTARRQVLAARIAETFAAHTPAVAAALVGSTARGANDRYSDIDMTMFYKKMPSIARLRAAREALGATSWGLLGGVEGEAEFAESFVVDGVECQVGHADIATFETLMADVLERGDTDHDKHTVMGGIAEAMPLLGAERVEAWRARAGTYPDALAEAMVRDHLKFRPRWFMEHRIDGRDTFLIHYRLLERFSRNILGILLGLNRLYPEHDFKRMGLLIERMPHRPIDLDRRLRRMFQSEYVRALDVLYPLVEETLVLVGTHMPQIDLAPARAALDEADPGEDLGS